MSNRLRLIGWIAVACSLLVAPLFAQGGAGGGGGVRPGAAPFSGGGPFVGQLLAPVGCTTVPYSFQSNTGDGLCLRSASNLDVSTGGTARFEFSGVEFRLVSSGLLGWSSGAIGTAPDVYQRRSAAKTLTIDTDGASGALTTVAILASNLNLNAATVIAFGAQALISNVADGVLRMSNNAGTGFTRLILGTNDATANGLSLVLNAGALNVKTGDGTAFANLSAAAIVGSGTITSGNNGFIIGSRGSLIGVSDGVWEIVNNAGTSFGRQIYGSNDATANGFSLNLNGGVAEVKTGDATAFASLKSLGYTASGASIVTAANTTTVAPITLTHGTLLTSAAVDAVENDAAAFYSTVDTTNGRRFDDGWNYFRLTGSGTGITTIADFFGTNDGIPMVANGVYEIEWYCYFSQATAGTATWTVVTATTALANITGEYIGAPIAGIGAVGTPQTAAINTTASSSTAFPVTGTEATGVTHFFVVRVLATAGNGASNTRLRLAMSAGTATPLINSYFRVRRLPGGNTGAFVS